MAPSLFSSWNYRCLIQALETVYTVSVLFCCVSRTTITLWSASHCNLRRFSSFDFWKVHTTDIAVRIIILSCLQALCWGVCVIEMQVSVCRIFCSERKSERDKWGAVTRCRPCLTLMDHLAWHVSPRWHVDRYDGMYRHADITIHTHRSLSSRSPGWSASRKIDGKTASS